MRVSPLIFQQYFVFQIACISHWEEAWRKRVVLFLCSKDQHAVPILANPLQLGDRCAVTSVSHSVFAAFDVKCWCILDTRVSIFSPFTQTRSFVCLPNTFSEPQVLNAFMWCPDPTCLSLVPPTERAGGGLRKCDTTTVSSLFITKSTTLFDSNMSCFWHKKANVLQSHVS